MSALPQPPLPPKLFHKDSFSLQSEATDISPNPSPLHNTHFKFQSTAPLSQSRFLTPISSHFICQVCQNIVKDPQECISCENLLCSTCLLTQTSCPHSCSTFQFKKIAKYAEVIYNTLILSCKNKDLGCPFVETVSNVLVHEESCNYSLEQCENSLCDRLVLRKSFMNCGTPLLCSKVCESLIRFSLMIDENNDFETCKGFKEMIGRCKEMAEGEVGKERMERERKVNESKKWNEECRKRKERIEKEIGDRINSFHPGKWNLRKFRWTCCGGEVESVGCKRID